MGCGGTMAPVFDSDHAITFMEIMNDTLLMANVSTSSGKKVWEKSYPVGKLFDKPSYNVSNLWGKADIFT